MIKKTLYFDIIIYIIIWNKRLNSYQKKKQTMHLIFPFALANVIRNKKAVEKNCAVSQLSKRFAIIISILHCGRSRCINQVIAQLSAFINYCDALWQPWAEANAFPWSVNSYQTEQRSESELIFFLSVFEGLCFGIKGAPNFLNCLPAIRDVSLSCFAS